MPVRSAPRPSVSTLSPIITVLAASAPSSDRAFQNIGGSGLPITR